MTGIAAAARLPACAAQLHLGERACSNKDVSKRQERSTARKGESFEKFLESPMAKLALSMIPSTNPPEVLRQLLQSAHDQGFGAGAGDVAMDMIESLFKNDRSGRAGSKP